jgi:GT2 family glycosyltransferase
VVCSYNGEPTIRDCFEGIAALEYPDFEVIVVDDGSIDRTAAIAREYGFQVIRTDNHGLSSARNTGLQAATGEILAYIDDDAYPDRHWLRYLAATFVRTSYVGVGGPNIAPPGDGPVAECVANAPGGPNHVLLSEQDAEHIPGCNMAFRKAALEAVGGFDPRFRVAGDDVDVCWRLQERGWKLGFSPAAVVWHHRRASLQAYWRQQVGYGKGEALLERKWPQKYNAVGHITWAGHLYGSGLTRGLDLRRQRIYHGTWGSALFQKVYQPATSMLGALLHMPEWYILIMILAAISALGTLWAPLLIALLLLAVTLLLTLLQAGLGASRARFNSTPHSRTARLLRWSLTALLHLIQPLARLFGRARHGLTPWRWRGPGFSVPWPRRTAVWSQSWQAPAERLRSLEAALRATGARVSVGGSCERWDLELRTGLFGAARVLTAVEEHGGGAQLVRARVWPRCRPGGLAILGLVATVATLAAFDRAWAAAMILGGVTALFALRALSECGAATATFLRVLKQQQGEP